MSIKTRFNPEEWADLCSAPFAAAAYVATAEGNTITYTQEMVALTRAIDASRDAAGELAQAVVGEFGGRFGNHLGTGDQAIARDDRAAMLALVGRAGDALARAGGHEAAPFAAWVISLARQAAAASIAGGFFGLGGRPISAAEEAAISAVKHALRAGAP